MLCYALRFHTPFFGLYIGSGCGLLTRVTEIFCTGDAWGSTCAGRGFPVEEGLRIWMDYRGFYLFIKISDYVLFRKNFMDWIGISFPIQKEKELYIYLSSPPPPKPTVKGSKSKKL